MLRKYKLEGIILKRKNIHEADKIITLLSFTHGKVVLIAKGARKIKSRRASHLELFNKVDLTVYKSRNFVSVTEVQTIEGYPNIRSDIRNLAYVFRIAEILDRLCAENEENKYIYFLLCDFLKSINDSDSADIEIHSADLILRILWELGFLAQGKILKKEAINSYLEEILENRLKSNSLLSKV
jgi:DNA repair protein RecO (recombination protein O)